MNAIDLLKRDHRKFERLTSELESTTERAIKTRERLFAELKEELIRHEEIEEEILYPALKEHPQAREIVLEGYEEHHVVDLILGELQGLEVSDETWTAKFSVMKESLDHHIEEEESDMFVKAEKLLSQEDLESLGDRMQRLKQKM
jgi:iron-sulfur cluster repair protein YtfE (RIC family)